MVVRLKSVAFRGIEVIDVGVEVQITSGIPSFTIVGLADKTIAESKERVRAALSAIGLALPMKRILVNLTPADLLKEGSHFDLPIACAILTATNILPLDEMQEYLIIGELSLDGSILAVNGALPSALGAAARDKGLICAKENGSEAAWSGSDKILAASNILELVNHFKGVQVISAPVLKEQPNQIHYEDLSDIKGQKTAKRALEIAAAGFHNLLMSGAPGSGKSMLAQRLPSIMPKMTAYEILECSAIASVAGNIRDGSLSAKRPFIAPHHSCSAAALVGGGMGRRIKPGAISLAHNGVLFLDELPEFPGNALESLRQPLESGEILIARANMHIKYPANFQLIAAMNPCKCGYLSDAQKACSRAPKCGEEYQSRISGPILDRFDLYIEVNIQSEEYSYYGKSEQEQGLESSQKVAERVEKARNLQRKRYEGYNITSNSRLDGSLLIEYAAPSDDGRDLLNAAAKKFKISMRSYNRVLRVARTIADLEGVAKVNKMHIAEALSYRNWFIKN